MTVSFASARRFSKLKWSILRLAFFVFQKCALSTIRQNTGMEPPRRNRQRLKGVLALLPEPVLHQGLPLPLEEAVIGKTVVAILLVDSRQPLSLQLLSKIRAIQNPEFQFFVSNQRPDTPLPNQTQCYALPGLGNAHTVLGFDACPGLAVICVETGRKFSLPQEELGLLWNSTEDVSAAWVEELSTCLTSWDRLKAGVLFPCTIQ